MAPECAADAGETIGPLPRKGKFVKEKKGTETHVVGNRKLSSR